MSGIWEKWKAERQTDRETYKQMARWNKGKQ